MNLHFTKAKATAVVVQQLFSWVAIPPFLIFYFVYSIYNESYIGFTFIFIFLAITSVNLPPSKAYESWIDSWQPRKYFRSFRILGHLEKIKKSKSMLLYHPHGMLCIGFNLGGGWAQEFRPYNMHWLLSDALANLPLVRWIVNWQGQTMGISNFRRLISQGANIAMTVGGFESATITEYGKHRVWIKNRKAFVKHALRHGYQLHPVYVFGESSTYWTFPYFLKFRLFLNSFNIPGVAFFANGPLPFANVDIAVVVGKPVQLPTIPAPTQHDVDRYHQIYIEALVKLFDEHKMDCITDLRTGSGSAREVKLEIW